MPVEQSCFYKLSYIWKKLPTAGSADEKMAV